MTAGGCMDTSSGLIGQSGAAIRERAVHRPTLRPGPHSSLPLKTPIGIITGYLPTRRIININHH
eukprot:7400398-Heterocapsa_arctica.AAC.1